MADEATFQQPLNNDKDYETELGIHLHECDNYDISDDKKKSALTPANIMATKNVKSINVKKLCKTKRV